MTPAVCAIVVTYQPDTAILRQLLKQLNDSACDFWVIDNHSDNAAALRDDLSALQHCRGSIFLDHNVGQAQALNQALASVQAAGYGLAFLFDQDSGIDPDFVARMGQAWASAKALPGTPLAALGPRLQDPRTGHRFPFRTFTRLFERSETLVQTEPALWEAAFLITSGALIDLQHLSTIGGMRGDYFIDNVDLEWCFRARAKGFRLLGTDHAHLHHRIGEDGQAWAVRRGLVVQHSPLRFYYSSRNRLHLHGQAHAPWTWRIKDGVRFVLKSLYLLVGSPQRGAYWQSLRRAWRDVHNMP
jgi:rhamnosyltransferase